MQQMETDMRTMTDDEFLDFGNVVKCKWITCAGGMGLSGCGRCSFRGDFTDENCTKFIEEEEYTDKIISEWCDE